MKEDATPSFTVELRLRIFSNDESAIDKSLEAGRMLFLLGYLQHADFGSWLGLVPAEQFRRLLFRLPLF